MPFYPDLNIQLDVALMLLEQEQDYLDDEACPWSEQTKEALRALKEGSDETEPTGDKWERLESEASKLYRDLKKATEGLAVNDHAEKMAYFRTATSLLEKLVGLQERALGLRHISQFQQTVLDIMEEVMTPNQRTEVMERLQTAVKGE